MTNQPIKCESKDYNVPPFYIIQTNGTDQRYVVSFQDALKIKEFMLKFSSKAEIENLLRFHNFRNKDKPEIYTGVVSKEEFSELIEKYNDLIMYNGFHDLMLRNSATGEYFAFEEHGLIYIYTSNDYKQELDAYGLEFKENQELIDSTDHWHLSKVSDEKMFMDMIAEFNLNKIN